MYRCTEYKQSRVAQINNPYASWKLILFAKSIRLRQTKQHWSCCTWSFYSGDFEDFYILRYNAVQSGENRWKFWKNSSISNEKVYPNFFACFMLVSFSVQPSALKMDTRSSSKNVSGLSPDYTALYPSFNIRYSYNYS